MIVGIKLLALILVGVLTIQSAADQPFWRVRPTGSPVSLRGVATARHAQTGSDVVWAAGAKGTVLCTSDHGATWHFCGPENFGEVDFRSIHAWNQNEAIIASAGTPAVVLKTVDAGRHWVEVLRDPHPKAFFDGLRFIDSDRGVLFGDPVDDRFMVVTTQDRGEHWQRIEATLPKTLAGEAAFAASNSAMLVVAPDTILIGTGGTESDQSRVLVSKDFGKQWTVTNCPLFSNPSSGIFSIAHSTRLDLLVAVGGDYRPDAASKSTTAFSRDGGRTFQLCPQQAAGYRSAVVSLDEGRERAKPGLYATGPAGTDWSEDGLSWQALDTVGFHALAITPGGTLVAVGSDGRSGWSE